MLTIRRIYRYIVAFISLEVVLWGLIELARSTFSSEIIGGSASQLARSLSLLFVGLPIFLLHWIPIQKSAAKDEEEQSSLIRALFLYAVLLSTLIPIVQNVFAIVNRVLLNIFQIPLMYAIVGQSQNWIDNLVAIVMNGLIAGYILFLTRENWTKPPIGNAFTNIRRLYRYIWVLYGLAMLIGGIILVIQHLLSNPEIIGNSPQSQLANGLGLLVIGVPLWLITWMNVQRSLEQSEERTSFLRLLILYTLKLIGIGGVLIPFGVIFYNIFKSLLEATFVFQDLLYEINIPLSTLIPLGGVWLYYGIIQKRDSSMLPEISAHVGVRRIYFYLLAFIGLASLWIGLQMLISYMIDVLIISSTIESGLLLEQLSSSLATLFVAIPLWILSWRSMIKETDREGEAGDHARRSLVRKTYLYVILFAGVIGVMITAGGLIFELLKSILGDPSSDLWRKSLGQLEMLSLFLLFLAYHWQIMRNDNRLAENHLAAQHAEFPVLIITSEIGDFSEKIINAIQRETNSLPSAVFLIENGIPDENLSEAKAIILPSDLCVSPPEALRLWLQDYEGLRLIIPTPVENWHWVLGSGSDLSKTARQAARIVRHLAEGEEIPEQGEGSAWRIVLYVVAAIFAIPLFLSIASMLFSFVFD